MDSFENQEKFYTILENDVLITAASREVLAEDYPFVAPLPDDYEFRKYIAKDGQLIRNPDYEKEEFTKAANCEIRSLKQFLTDTDYVILKIDEALAEGDEEEAERLRTKYADTIQQRKVTRERIRQLEYEIEHYGE